MIAKNWYQTGLKMFSSYIVEDRSWSINDHVRQAQAIYTYVMHDHATL